MIEDSIHLARDTGISDIIITGDFNYNTLNLVLARKISNICQTFDLFQTISEPTHFTEHSSSILDLIFVSNNDSVFKTGVMESFLDQEQRYHCPIFGFFKFRKPKTNVFKRRVWYYDRGDYNSLRQSIINTDWNKCYDNDLAIYSSNITEVVLNLSLVHIPSKCVYVKSSEPPWINTAVKRKIRSRKRAYRKAKQTQSEYHWSKFKSLRNVTIKFIRESKKIYYDKLSSKLRSPDVSSKNWWKILRQFIPSNKNSQTNIPPLKNNDDIVHDQNEKAMLFNNFFRDQSSLDDRDAEIPNNQIRNVENSLNSIVTTSHEVQLIMKGLPLGKATGPDGINNRILRELSAELSAPLSVLFNKSLGEGKFPSNWKDAHICTVLKKGDPSLVSNYRPISLLNTMEKVFERVIFKHLFNYLRDTNFLTPLQSGFVPGDSTVNQLISIYNTFCQALEQGKEVRVIFLDISKAFDKVWIKGLLYKLRRAGIGGKLHDCLSDYLSNRRQRVLLPGGESDWTIIKAGVPQGSILGPILFLIYINDIVDEIHSNIKLFADDTSLFLIVDNPESTANTLQTDINKIISWSHDWLVTFNPSKTESLLISRKSKHIQHPPLSMSNQIISEVSMHKHLGVLLSNNCTWHSHIDHIKEKSWARINLLRKLKFTLDRRSLEIIYFSFIRPLLEYADVIWGNCTTYEKIELDKIQNEAGRVVTGATKLVSIEDLYNDTKWEKLECRRQKHRLILFYKMVNGLTPAYLSTLVPPYINDVSRYSLRNANNIQAVAARSSLYSNSFLPTAIREWNELPLEIKK